MAEFTNGLTLTQRFYLNLALSLRLYFEIKKPHFGNIPIWGLLSKKALYSKGNQDVT